jgi:uncharacterized protein (DUF3084 family)
LDKISFLAKLHADHEAVCWENEHLGSAMECLRDEMYEEKASHKPKKGKLHRAEEEHDTHRTAAEQKAKEADQLSAALQGKEGELQQECAALSEVRSQLAPLLKRGLAPSASVCHWRMCRRASLRPSGRPRSLRGLPLP